MKNKINFFGITAVALVIGLLSLSCASMSGNNQTILKSPANLKIDVTGRTMIVSWDEVANASGYEIITFSENCGSGRRKINTRDGTAVVNFPESVNNGKNALLDNASDGAVVILEKTKIQITLMPAIGNAAIPMATAVTAKVMSFGSDNKYLDSDYSSVVRKELGSGMGEK